MIALWGEDLDFDNIDDKRCTDEPSKACARDVDCPGQIHLSCRSIEQRDPVDATLNHSWSMRGGCGWMTRAPGQCSLLPSLGCYSNAGCPSGTGTCVANPTGTGGAWHTGRIGLTTAAGCLGSGADVQQCQGYETISGAGDLRWFELLVTPGAQKVHRDIDPDGDPTHAAEIRNFAWNLSLDLPDAHATFTWEVDNNAVGTVCRLLPTRRCYTDADCPSGTGGCLDYVPDLAVDDAVLGSITGPFGAVGGGDPTALGGYPMFAPLDTGGNSFNVTRQGDNACFFEGPGVSSPPYLLATPTDGAPFTTFNGPIRNMDITRLGGPDLTFELLEDRIGDAGDAFQGAFGFMVTQKAQPGDPDPQPGFGAAVDDVVLEWREFTLVERYDRLRTGRAADHRRGQGRRGRADRLRERLHVGEPQRRVRTARERRDLRILRA